MVPGYASVCESRSRFQGWDIDLGAGRHKVETYLGTLGSSLDEESRKKELVREAHRKGKPETYVVGAGNASESVGPGSQQPHSIHLPN